MSRTETTLPPLPSGSPQVLKYKLVNEGMNGTAQFIVASSEEEAFDQAKRIARDPEYSLHRLPDDFELVAHSQTSFMRVFTDGDGDEILGRI